MPGSGIGVGLNRKRGGLNFAAPRNLAAIVSGTSGSRTIDASWDHPVTVTPGDYTIQLSTDGVDWGAGYLVIYPGNTYSFVDVSDAVYYFRVQANYNSGRSPWVVSDPIDATG